MVWAILNEGQSDALSEIIKFDSDRVAAILGGAMLDDSLRQTLENRLRPSKDINGKLFKISGALSSLGAKIDIAYQLYMFENPMRDAMYGICEVRNSFAHNMKASFKVPDAKLLVSIEKLNLHKDQKKYQYPPNFPVSKLPQAALLYEMEPVTDNRTRYIVNLKLCLMWLMGDFNRHAPNSNLPRP